MGVKFCDLGLSKELLNMTPKASETKRKKYWINLAIKKLKRYVLQRVTSRKQKDNKQN